MQFHVGDIVRLEHDLDGIDAGDFVVVSSVGPWLRIGRLFDDVVDIHANLLGEFATPLGVEAEVEGGES